MGLGILKLFAPFLPHLTETLYQQLYASEQETSLHATRFDAHDFSTQKKEDTAHIDKLITIISRARKLKSEHKLSLGTPLKILYVHSDSPEELIHIRNEYVLLSGITKAEKIEESTEAIDQSYLIQEQDAWIMHIKY